MLILIFCHHLYCVVIEGTMKIGVFSKYIKNTMKSYRTYPNTFYNLIFT